MLLTPETLVSDNLEETGPRHRRLYAALRERVLSGELAPGQRLPASRTLARQLGVSRNTVLAAYEQLLAEGFLQAQVGRGTFVSSRLPEPGAPEPLAPAAPDTAAADTPPPLSRAAQRLLAQPRWYRAMFGSGTAPARFDFRVGGGSLDDAGLKIWRRLLQQAAGELTGHYDHPQGQPGLREAVIEHLRRQRGCRAEAEQVVIVNGSQQALDLIARLLLDEGDTALVENPGYRGARAAFHATGAHLRPVPVDEEGPVVEAVAEVPARLMYLTPSHQFPTGAVTSVARRLALLDWAEQHNAFLVEDDYDSELNYAGRPLACMQSLDRRGRVIYVGTFSRLLGPSLRLGYVVLPPALVEPFQVLRWMSDRQSPAVLQRALTRWLTEGHNERHLRRMRKRYGERRAQLLMALEENFEPGEVEVRGSHSGLHCVVWFPQLAEKDAETLVRALAERGLRVSSIAPHYEGEAPGCALLLGWTQVEAGDMALVAGLLREVVQLVQKNKIT